VTVYLVGAGPGDPGLLTVRGAELLAAADVVIYDRLSVADLLDLAPLAAERISVGKTPGGPTVPQDEINRLLIEHGAAGKHVVRLKGGDPFVFARGGEEAQALIEAGIDIEVVPGITSAIAAPSAAGIPLTLRYSSMSFTVITGHEDPTKDTSIDWPTVAKLGGTIVILMGVGRWPKISAALIEGGLAPDTPAAAVRWGTRPEQETTRATLGTLGDHDLRSPSTIVVGEVAAVDVGWFEKLPLFGKRIVVTRTREQASELAHLLRRRGAAPIEIPTIAIVDPDDAGAALRGAVADLAGYDWVALTSANGAARFCAELRDARSVGQAQIAAIGPGTAKVLAAKNLVADLIGERFVAEGLLEAFPAPPDGGGRVLLARAADARDVLPDGLRSVGWNVDVVSAYRTVPPEVTEDSRAALADADIVTFTSSSTVRHFVDMVGLGAVPAVVACIGPVTAATARGLGITVDIEAGEHTIAGLVAAIEAHTCS
jgi:uroporphyrinogen III methyltransferase/synthase